MVKFLYQIFSEGKNDIQRQINIAENATVRFLLQCRHLSQVTASTWLDENYIDDNDRGRIKLIRKIFETYNILPQNGGWIDNNKNKQFFDFYIEKDHLNYSSISLVLLLSGQAYYQDTDQKYKQISASIFSTYEMIWEYGIDLSWDTFYATRIDISQSGGTPKPPFTKVTLSYPPRPNEFSLKQKDINKWVRAKEEYEEGNEYPFYPQPCTPAWRQKELNFIVPPHPYLPLSCM